ncbi:hypothetical protein BDR04DRAFT_1130903 [Suillus decipiens]|nr:hypothetical protein BDR04DRAFT_1130903 [Suillus decipiens]
MDEVHDEDDTYWDNLDDMDLNGFINGLLSCATSKSDGSDIKQMAPVRCTAIITIYTRNLLTVMHTPQKVIDMLSHIGISISTDSIHAANTLHTIGKSLLALYAYDNFDVDLKSQVPQAEKSNETLKHLTSSLLFLLEYGVTTNDLKCSEEFGNIHPVVDLLAQGGIYDPDADILDNPDISQHVILIHGDLGTGEHLQSAQL